MRKVYFLALAIFLLSNQSAAQTYTWIGGATGDYTVAANWSPVRSLPSATDILSFNATSSIALTNTPTQTIAAIQIASGANAVTFAANGGNTLTLTAAIPLIYATPASSILSADFLTISLSNPGSFTLSSGTFGISPGTGGKIIINGALVLSGGTLDFDVVGTGGTIINSGASITYNTGTFNCINASAIFFAAGSNYYHAASGAAPTAIPICRWDVSAPGATCNVTGMNSVSFAPTGLTNSFSNFTWNCATQSADVDLNIPAAMNVAGNLKIVATNSKYVRLAGAAGGTLTAGTYTQTNGNIMLQSSSGTTVLTVIGLFSQSDGIIDAVGGVSAGIGTLEFKGDVSTTKAGIWQSNGTNTSAQWNLVFSGIALQAVNFNGTTPQSFSGKGTCNIAITNADKVTGVSLTGRMYVINRGNMSTAATCTMSGVLTSGSIYYSNFGGIGTTLIYSGNFFQTATAFEFPTSAGNEPTNLTITNSLGLTFPAAFSRTITGTLTMAGGNLNVGNGNTLILSNATLSTQLNYTSGFITTGTLTRNYPASGLPTVPGSTSSLFPFGTGSNDRSLNIYFSAGSISTGGTISVSHTPVVGVISPLSILDNTVTLDKTTATYWTISTGSGFTLGGTTTSITAVGGNIGAIDNIVPLRLTDGMTPDLGGLIGSTGTTSIPVVGKFNLPQTTLNTNLYIGSDGLAVYNPLIIITFTWTGLGGNTNWKNAGNWSAPYTFGFPSSSTEIAIITNTSAPVQPTIYTNDNINVYRLTVGAGMTLTLQPSSGVTVFDQLNFSGTAAFDPLSTFGYANASAIAQNIAPLIYGNLALSGAGPKVLPSTGTITVKGLYSVLLAYPSIGTSTFIYAGAGTQTITAAAYYNLTIAGNRAGGTIKLGPNIFPTQTIDIANVFDVSTLTGVGNYVVDYSTVNFSSTGTQTIPGFTYQTINNNNNVIGPRILDPLGSGDPTHVIVCVNLNRPEFGYTVIGSKVKLCFLGISDPVYLLRDFYDLEIGTYKPTQNGNGHTLDFWPGFSIGIAGKFTVTLTNYKLGTNVYTLNFNGTGNQTITSFKTNTATNTPSFKYSNVTITGGNRDITVAGTDTLGIRGALTVPASFSAGNGFVTTGSTVNFSVGSSSIPVLVPKVTGSPNYNNITISGGTRIFAGNMLIGGNVEVSGGIDASPATLTIGGGSAVTRTATILGNMLVNGGGSGSVVTGQIDLNPGTLGSTTVNLAGNLSISGNGQLMGTTSTGTNNGVVLYNGITPQTYSNTSTTFKNGLVSFVVGDGTLASNVTLGSSMNLLASSTTQNKSTFTVKNNSSLDCGINNIISNGTGNAIFNLNAGATLLTANTGGIEGPAIGSSTGSIINDATISKVYDPLASYQFNASTVSPFPAAITPMANLTIGDNSNVQLNKSIEVSNTFTLKNSASSFDLSVSDLTLKSTATATARVAAVPAGATVSYSSTGRFNVERNYQGLQRAWYLVTSPLAEAGSVFDTWQNGSVNTTGKGTWVTGTIAGNASNGLDNGPQLNSSLKVGDALTVVNNTKSELLSNTGASAVNKGFFLFVRGDRIPANFNTSNWNATTLSSRGKIQTGSQFFPSAAIAGGYKLIGNPYASPVNYTNATRTNLTDFVYIWDPQINSSIGAYVAITLKPDGTVLYAIPSSSMAPELQPLILQSSQAFWVQSASSGASVQFNEVNKSALYNASGFRQMRDLTKSFRTNLNLVEPNDSIILADGNFVQFDNQYSKGVDLNDALKFGNIKEMLAFQRDGKTLAVERRPEITLNDTLFFKLAKTTQRNYQFQFVPTNMAGTLTAYLEDSYSNVKTMVSLTATSTFNFTINGDAASAAYDRFRIVFTASAAGPLPVTYKTIKAYQQGKDIAVDWTVENEINISKYEVEKSTDGTNFIKVNATTAKATSGSIDYSFVDTKAVQGNNFYRIKNYNLGGSYDYSRVVVVKLGKAGSGISIYPNPVSGNSIGMAMTNMAQGIYQLRLINTIGQTVMTKRICHSTGNSMETFTSDSQLSTGIYQLEVTAPDKRISSIKVIVQ